MAFDLSKFIRQSGAGLIGAALFSALAGMPAQAEDSFPGSEPLVFVSAYPAGSGADVFVRYYANEINKMTGHTVIVENKPGAAGNIASEYVARAKPDGHTIYVHGGSATSINYYLWKNPPLDPRKAFRGVAGINKLAFYITVGAESPFKTIADLNAHLKKAGKDATYATSNSSGRLLAAQYIEELGVKPVEVSYGSAAEVLPDLVSLAVDFAVMDPANAVSKDKEGTLRILATGAGERLSVVPHVPTLAESGLNIDQLTWWAAWAPAETPDDIVNALNAMFAKVIDKPETPAFLANTGTDVWKATPQQVDAALVKLMEETKRLVELANLPKN